MAQRERLAGKPGAGRRGRKVIDPLVRGDGDGDDPFTVFDEAFVAYQATFRAGELPAPPRLRLAILTCMDARLDVLRLFGLCVGDAHVVRNAGGRCTDDVVRSLILSTIRLGVEMIAVVHHTRCGATETTQLDMCDQVLDRTGSDPAGIDFEFFRDDTDRTLRSDVQRLLDCPYIPAGTAIAGFRFDVRIGAMTRVIPTRRVRPHHAEHVTSGYEYRSLVPVPA